MSTKTTLALSIIAATALFVIAPALIQSASAIPAPKTDPSCNDPKFEGTRHEDDCPGKSESAESDVRDIDCEARNRGHQDECEALVDEDDGDVTVVNPPKDN